MDRGGGLAGLDAPCGYASAECTMALGREVGDRTVVLFHHSPDRTDDEIGAIAAAMTDGSVPMVVASEELMLEL